MKQDNNNNIQGIYNSNNDNINYHHNHYQEFKQLHHVKFSTRNKGEEYQYYLKINTTRIKILRTLHGLYIYVSDDSLKTGLYYCDWNWEKINLLSLNNLNFVYFHLCKSLFHKVPSSIIIYEALKLFQSCFVLLQVLTHR